MEAVLSEVELDDWCRMGVRSSRGIEGSGIDSSSADRAVEATSRLTGIQTNGEGMVVVPSAVQAEVSERYSLLPIGRIPEITERFFAITVERRLKHPAVVAISEASRESLFG